MIHMRISMPKIKNIMTVYADRIWINKESHPYIFQRCIGRMKPILYMSITISAGITLYIVMPIFVIVKDNLSLDSPNKPLPYHMLFPYDHQIPAYYFPTFLWCIYIGYILILQACAMDVIFSEFVSFTCGQFEILHGRMARLIPVCYEEWRKNCDGNTSAMGKENFNHLQRIYNRRLHDISIEHSELLRFCVDLENLYAFPLMANVLASSLVISFGGFQIVVNKF
ncbi:odorant receptor 13a-like [Haematobia irritans]|uniref:odorant receptor 13a-like n=1 Tax=Haematobia irritans TaxID=7368 RepID=UPI003F508909